MTQRTLGINKIRDFNDLHLVKLCVLEPLWQGIYDKANNTLKQYI